MSMHARESIVFLLARSELACVAYYPSSAHCVRMHERYVVIIR